MAVNMNIIKKLERHAPPGVNLSSELTWFAFGCIISTVYSLGYLVNYTRCRDRLFLWDGLKKVLDTRAVMPDFVAILGGSLNGFLVLAMCMAVLAVYHYAYHFQGAKSIYLMKRLPNRWEMPRRLVTLPVLGVAACMGISFLLLLGYFVIYMAFTPSACLTPYQWQKIWSAFMGVAL